MTAEVSAVVAIIAALISSMQVLVSRSASRSVILRDAMKNHWSPESVSERDLVYGLEGKSYGEWSRAEQATAASVAMQISQIGFLLRNSYADRNAFLDFWAPWCVRLFTNLSPFIADERVGKNAPDQFIHFEWLARKACGHLKRKPWWETRSWETLKRRTSELPDPNAIIEQQGGCPVMHDDGASQNPGGVVNL